MTNAASRMLRPLLPVAVVAIGAGVGVGFAGTANAASASSTVKVAATDDSYTSTDRPTYTFGASDALYAGTVDGDTMVSYLKFTVPAGSKVSGATVTLTRDSHKFPAGALKLSKVATTAWAEKTLSTKNHPTVGAAVVSVTPKPADASVSFDVSSVVKGAGTYTFAVSGASTKDAAHFQSSEANTGKPLLVLAIAPVATVPTSPATPNNPVIPATPTTPATPTAPAA